MPTTVNVTLDEHGLVNISVVSKFCESCFQVGVGNIQSLFHGEPPSANVAALLADKEYAVEVFIEHDCSALGVCECQGIHHNDGGGQ